MCSGFVTVSHCKHTTLFYSDQIKHAKKIKKIKLFAYFVDCQDITISSFFKRKINKCKDYEHMFIMLKSRIGRCSNEEYIFRQFKMSYISDYVKYNFVGPLLPYFKRPVCVKMIWIYRKLACQLYTHRKPVKKPKTTRKPKTQ